MALRKWSKGDEMGNQGVLSRRTVWAMSIFVFLFMAITCGWALEDDQGLNTVSGRIEDIDSLKSIITVRYPDPVSGNMEEIDILVPEEAKIMNGAETISFLDIEQFDSVTVTYDGDGASGFKAREILELNQATA